MSTEEPSSAGVPPAVSGASRPRFGEVAVRDRGRLPHWETEGGVYFVTFRLADSLPASVLQQIVSEREDLIATTRHLGRELTSTEISRLSELESQRIEAYLDRGAGACFMLDGRIAGLIADALVFVFTTSATGSSHGA